MIQWGRNKPIWGRNKWGRNKTIIIYLRSAVNSRMDKLCYMHYSRMIHSTENESNKSIWSHFKNKTDIHKRIHTAWFFFSFSNIFFFLRKQNQRVRSQASGFFCGRGGSVWEGKERGSEMSATFYFLTLVFMWAFSLCYKYICFVHIYVCVFGREAWHAAVRGVAKSWTQLSDWTDICILNCTKLKFCFSL